MEWSAEVLGVERRRVRMLLLAILAVWGVVSFHFSIMKLVLERNVI